MKPCPVIMDFRTLLLTMILTMVGGAVHPQVPDRSSWAVGVQGTAETGIVRGRVDIPLALGTAPGTTYQDIAITGGVTYDVGLQVLVAFRPPSSPMSVGMSLGMKRRHVAASGDVGERLLTDLDGGQADLLYDQTLMIAAIDGLYRMGKGWHLFGSLGMELPLSREQAALWIFETGSLRMDDRLQRRSGVRYRTTVDDCERFTIGGGLARDLIVGMHGNTGVFLTPQLAVVTGSSLAAGASWLPITIRMSVALTWAL